MAAAEGKADVKKTPWTAEEDEALRREVRRHGPQNWAAIAVALPGRGAKSCRLRWCQHLAPELDSRPFTPEEDARIVEQQRIHGNKWATIARYLRGRSDNAVKNRWNSALRRNLHLHLPGGGNHRAVEDVDDQPVPAAPPACLELFPLRAGGLRKEDDVASMSLTQGLHGVSEAELALGLGPVRP